MSELALMIAFLVSVPLLTLLFVFGINSIVTPWEFSEYKWEVMKLRHTGYTDKEICKKLKISKSFLKKLENEVSENE